MAAVIRLAEDIPNDGQDSIHYVAIGRAGALDSNRAKSSEPIKVNEGIPKVFRSTRVGCNGVLFFHDLDKAIRHGIYKETINEKVNPNDYKCVIAVPINGFDGERKDLIGILTITARSKKILRVQHIDALRAIGDQLADYYSSTIVRLEGAKRMPALDS
jgi:hypothetical protein